MSQEQINNLQIKEYHFEVFSNEGKLFGVCLLPLVVIAEMNVTLLHSEAHIQKAKIKTGKKEYRSNAKDYELSEDFKREFKLDFTL